MPNNDFILDLPGFEVKKILNKKPLCLSVIYTGEVYCPHCNSRHLRKKDTYTRKVRHENLGKKPLYLEIKAYKYKCKTCGKYFNQRFPGILPYSRNTELFKEYVFDIYENSMSQSSLARDMKLGTATIERWFHYFFKRKNKEIKERECPRVMGIDEHRFSKKKGYATTITDLRKHKVFDITLGRSQKSLDSYLSKLKGREKVQMINMDLSETYRSIAKQYFPNAKIVADRFHVIKLINHHFLEQWKEIDPERRKNRGLLSLMRRHKENLKPTQKVKLYRYFAEVPAMKTIYEFKQDLSNLLRLKAKTKQEAKKLIPILLEYIEILKNSGLKEMITLGETIDRWKDEIARMWRFTKTNGITEGFHRKMKLIQRRAYGFKNFENYRMRVKILCA